MGAPKKRNTRPAPLTILLFEANGVWLAQAVEKDVASSGTSPFDALVGICASFEVHIAHDEALAREPLAGLPRAPKQFRELAKNAWTTEARGLPRRLGRFQPRVKLVGDGLATAHI